MPFTPISGTAAVREDIAGLLMQASVAKEGGIADVIMPRYSVKKKKGNAWYLPFSEAMRMPDSAKAKVQPGSTADRSSTTFGSISYTCQTHKLEEPLPDETRDEYADSFDMKLAVAALKDVELWRLREARVAVQIATCTTATMGNVWTSISSGTPVSDIDTALNAVLKRRGVLCNVLQVPFAVYRGLSINDQVRQKLGIAYNDALNKDRLLDLSALAAALGVKRVVVSYATYNSAARGQTASGAYIHPETKAFLCAAAESESEAPTLRPTFGRTFAWDRFGPVRVREYMEDDTESEIIEVAHSLDENVFDTGLGYIFGSVA